MDKITDDIIGFVEEGIFESAKAYSVIKAFENYLEVSFNELLSKYDWQKYNNLEPVKDSFAFVTPPRKNFGIWLACKIRIKIKENNSKLLYLEYRPFEIDGIVIHGFWDRQYFDYDNSDNLITTSKHTYGLSARIILAEKDKLNFKFNEYFSRILDVLTKHADQLK